MITATKIEELLGYGNNRSPDTETIRRAYYVQAQDENIARTEFQEYARTLPVPENMELGDIELTESKDVNHLFFASITFKTPEPRIKRQIADDLFELFGDKRASNRSSDTYERHFRVKADDTLAAHLRLESYIRDNDLTVGRMHLDEVSVSEQTDADGFFIGQVSYGNPDTFGSSDKVNGIVPAYGTRHALTKNLRETERIFQLRGYANSDLALAAMLASYPIGPATGIAGIDLDEDGEGADKLFIARVRYTAEREDTTAQVGFEVSCTQQHITNSIGTRGAWGPGALDYGGMIGVTNDGVEGIDIDVAQGSFTLSKFWHSSLVTPQFVQFLTTACGRVNSAPWRAYAAGEVRFIGASGGFRRDSAVCEVTYRFATSVNEENIRIGDITVPFKFGWDYLWIRHADIFENDITIKKPIAVYVEQVYHGMDMTALGLG
jgi:hypothetical protein